MQKTKIYSFAFCLLVSVSCYASPTITALGGGNFPSSRLDIGDRSIDVGTSGSSGGIQIMFPINGSMSFGFDYLFNDLGKDSSATLLAPLPANVEYDLKSQTFLAVTRFEASTPGDEFHPFIFGGLGIHRTTAQGNVTLDPGYVWSDTSTSESRRVLDDSSSNLAAAAGLGVDYECSKQISLGVEARYEYMKDTNFQTLQALPISAKAEGHIQTLALLARVSFHFGS